MSIEVVRKYLSDFGKGEQVMEFPVSSATVELAAQALGTCLLYTSDAADD